MKTKIFTIAGLFALILVLTGCQQAPKQDPNAAAEEKNKIAMQKVSDAFNTGNIEGLENYVSENVVEHSPDPAIKTTGLQGLKDMITSYRVSFPYMKMTALTMIAEGDMVIAHFNMKGTNTGPMGSMPATNKSFDINGVDIVKFADGKGVEHWGYYEEAKMMMQLGMMPSPQEGGEVKK